VSPEEFINADPTATGKVLKRFINHLLVGYTSSSVNPLDLDVIHKVTMNILGKFCSMAVGYGDLFCIPELVEVLLEHLDPKTNFALLMHRTIELMVTLCKCCSFIINYFFFELKYFN